MGIQTPMAQGRSTKIILTINLIRTSRLSIKIFLFIVGLAEFELPVVPESPGGGEPPEAGSYLMLIDSCITRLRLKDLLGPATRVKKRKKEKVPAPGTRNPKPEARDPKRKGRTPPCGKVFPPRSAAVPRAPSGSGLPHSSWRTNIESSVRHVSMSGESRQRERALY